MTPVADERQTAGRWLPGDTVAIAETARYACVLEVSAPKPGNVSPGRPFADVRHEDFVASAGAICEPLALADARPLGETILRAVEATARVTRANTNLGIVLLLAPLTRAAARLRSTARPDDRLLARQTEARQVLAETTVDDARKVFQAIRLANPGGLGRADDQDVAREPTVTLREAMQLAADRDGIAREYSTAFARTFQQARALTRARAEGLSWTDAIVETFLTLLAAQPDTHIARRAGDDCAARVSEMARNVLAAGGVRTQAGRLAVADMDRSLRDPRNLANPGTTADVTAAAIFVALLIDGGVPALSQEES
jgi:triphosphoribosyl-dephospho-CoA synthase